MSSLYSILSLVCSPSQNKVGFLSRDWSYFTCQQTDGIIALYWSPVISGCVIRNSTEFPYLEEEERRPWGKLRLWQEFYHWRRFYLHWLRYCSHTLAERQTRALSFGCSRVHTKPRQIYQVDAWHFRDNCTVTSFCSFTALLLYNDIMLTVEPVYSVML